MSRKASVKAGVCVAVAVACGGFATSAGAAGPIDSVPSTGTDSSAPTDQMAAPVSPAPAPVDQAPAVVNPAPADAGAQDAPQTPATQVAQASTDFAQQAPTEPAQAPAEPAVQAPTDLSQPATGDPTHGLGSTTDSPKPTLNAAKPTIGGGIMPVGPKVEIAKPMGVSVAGPLNPNLGVTDSVGQAVERGPSQVIAHMDTQLATVRGASTALPGALAADLSPDVPRSISAPLPSAPALSAPHSLDFATGETATALHAGSPTTAVVSPAFNSLRVASFGRVATGQTSQNPDPGKGPTGPGNGPGSSSNAAGPSDGLAFSGLAALLLAFMAFAAPALGQRIRISPACWRPVAFVSLLERPG